MKANFNLSIDISAEEFLTLAEGIRKAEEDRFKRNFNPAPMVHHSPVPALDLWIGKTVKIKSNTPDSEINIWIHKLRRDISYGVSEEIENKIKIQEHWFRKIWFEIV